MNRTRFLLVVLSLLPTSRALAQELVDPRVVGMGGVATAFSDDSTGLLENPAGLARILKWRAEILNASVMLSQGLTLAPSQIETVASSNDQSAQEAVNKLVGEQLTASAGFFPNFTMKNFGAGLVLNGGADARLRNQSYPRIEGKASVQVDGVVAGAYSFFDDALSLGLQATLGKRAQFGDVVGPASLASGTYDYRTVVREGFGMTFTSGVQVVAPPDISNWGPRFGVTVKSFFGFNISDPAPLYEGQSRELKLSEIPTEVGMGGGVSHMFGSMVRLRLGLAHDNVTTSDSPFLHLHMGAEGVLYKFLAVRAGIWQGYFTTGVGLDLRYIRLEAATYGVERGRYAGQHQDRRYVFQLVLGI